MKKARWIPYPRYIFRKTIALELIKKYVPPKSRFLEIGGGAGDFSRSLVKSGFGGKIIDYSKESHTLIKELSKGVKNLQIEKNNLFQLDKKEEYDLIIMFEVLEHLEQDKQAIKKIYSILKSGGYALISVPAKKRLWDSWDEMAGHIKRYEKKELIDLLESQKLEIIKFYSYGFPFINAMKFFRKYLIKKNNAIDKRMATKKSGLNIVKIPIIGILLNNWTLYPFIQFSKIFFSFDLAEGYLCLVKK
ncbi:class I SAM-dependent methyltransferase [Patescibacteria group bacterium]|nr:MAG: class I SAM-dependent methyltransferase [Patescibacteria group bacterium]